MKRCFACLCSWPLRHPWLSVGVVVLAVVGFLGGAHLYGDHHFRAARQARKENRLADAQQHIQQCLRVWRWRPGAHLLAARLARCDRDYQAAENHLKECKRLGGVTEDLQLEWLLLRAETGEIDNPEVEGGLWRCVEEDHPETGAILEAMARAQRREVRLQRALLCLNRWLEAEPDSFLALVQRAEVRQGLENEAAAEADYAAALEVVPGDREICLRLVSLMFHLHRSVEQIKPYVERLEKAHPDRTEVRVAVARLRLASGEVDEARQLLEAALTSDPGNILALTELGGLELQQGRPVEAERWLRKAVAKAPGEPSLLFSLSRSLAAQKGREKEAKEVRRQHDLAKAAVAKLGHLTRNASNGFFQSPEVAAEAGLLLLRLNQNESGVRWLETALELRPDHHEARRALIEYYEKVGNRQKAALHRQQLASRAKAPATKPSP